MFHRKRYRHSVQGLLENTTQGMTFLNCSSKLFLALGDELILLLMSACAPGSVI